MGIPSDPGHVDGAVHSYFELSYANYLILHRSILQSMPLEWQERFIQCIEEMDEAAKDIDRGSGYWDLNLLARRRDLIYEYESCPDCNGVGEIHDPEGEWIECERCNGMCEIEVEDSERYETAEEVGYVDDPVPHYDRGRTRLPLKTGKN